MRPFVLIGLVVLPLAFFAGCHRNPEKALASPGVNGAPDILKEIADHPGSPWKAWRVRAYHMNQIWSGGGAQSEGQPVHRVKITVWSEELDAPLAEFYFYDADEFHPNRDAQRNPDPAKPPVAGAAAKAFQLHFPLTVLGPVMSTLRNSNEAVYLYYYHNQWALGTATAETVGVD